MRTCLAFLALLFCSAVLAQDGRSPATQASAAGNTYLAGGNFRVTDPVAADLIAAGGRVSIEAPVAEDATLAGGSVDVRSPIGEDLRVAGGAVTILRDVGADLVAAGGNVQVEDSVRVGGAAWIAGSDVRLGGTVQDNAQLYGDHIVLAADVAGNARLVGRDLELAPGARIGGNLYYASSTPPRGLQTAQVGGQVIRLDPPEEWERHDYEGPGIGLLLPVFLVSMLVFGVILYLLFPNAVAGVSLTLHRHPWRSLALGFALLFTIPPLAVLAMITIVGLPLGFALLLLYPLILLLGYLATAFFLSRRPSSMRDRGADVGTGRQALFLALALLVLGLLAAIPFIGPLVFLLATVAGAGSLVTWAWLRIRKPPPPSTA